MVSKSKTSENESKKGRVKVGKLKLNKETIKDLTTNEKRKIKGGGLKPRLTDGCTTRPDTNNE